MHQRVCSLFCQTIWRLAGSHVSVSSLLFDSTKEPYRIQMTIRTYLFWFIYHLNIQMRKRRREREKKCKRKQELKQQLGRLIIEEGEEGVWGRWRYCELFAKIDIRMNIWEMKQRITWQKQENNTERRQQSISILNAIINWLRHRCWCSRRTT